jgi:predicted AAA+ superfamily ATPase
MKSTVKFLLTKAKSADKIKSDFNLPGGLMYIKRHLEKVVLDASKNFKVILVTGPRQVGKTTMLRKIASKERNYITLDNLNVREFARNDPSNFLQRYTPPVIIDEIQYAPELLSYIKIHVDNSNEKGSIWLTGSQMFHLMQNVSESLAGRVGIINMYGFSHSELSKTENIPFNTDLKKHIEKIRTTKKQSLKDVFYRIYKGSMPELYDSNNDIEMFYSSYLDTYIQRDINELKQVGNKLQFLRFLTACAARTSQMLNYNDIARDIGVSSVTVKEWFSIVLTTGLVKLIQPYHNNALKRIIKAPNMYFMDTGLCAYLTRWTNPESLEVSAMAGAFFETYAISEILKSYYNAGKRPPVYYYRDSDGQEIDLIIKSDGILYPIEIKKTGNPVRDSIKNFRVLKKTGKQTGQGNVICLCDDVIPINNENHYIPVWLI